MAVLTEKEWSKNGKGRKAAGKKGKKARLRTEAEMAAPKQKSPPSDRGANFKMCISCGTQVPQKSTRCFSCHTMQPMDLLDVPYPVVKERSTKYYTRYRITIEETQPCGTVLTFDKYVFKIKERYLAQVLGCIVAMSHMPTKKKQTRCFCASRSLLMHLPRLESSVHTNISKVSGPYEEILQWTRDEEEKLKKQIPMMAAYGKTTFDSLWYLFESGKRISYEEQGNVMGGSIKTSHYAGNITCDSFSVNVSSVMTTGEGFFYSHKNVVTPEFDGFKDLSALPIQELSKETYRMLKKRGKRFAKLAIGQHYQHYNGSLSNVNGFSWKVKANGRVMIDVETYKKYNPNECSLTNSTGRDVLTEVVKEEFYCCHHSLPGFSFKTKGWGFFLVSRISKISFDEHAFGRLVLPTEKKSLIAALVEEHRLSTLTIKEQEKMLEKELAEKFTLQRKPKAVRKKEKQAKKEAEELGYEVHDDKVTKKSKKVKKPFVDIISGKGGGCIFLLHGTPGTGKTLTAEAVSEHLQVPLYVVSVSELGCSPSALETNLQRVLELAATWGCAILLDEADIFLEKRASSDIVRNAMVGVFLRLLEYHQGVLFLTTNRIKCIDDAFSSRISVALHYTALDAAARTQVWTNFLEMAVPEAHKKFDFALLGSNDLNGRQIRSCVRIGQSLARHEKQELSMAQLQTTVNVCLNFRRQFEMLNQGATAEDLDADAVKKAGFGDLNDNGTRVFPEVVCSAFSGLANQAT